MTSSRPIAALAAAERRLVALQRGGGEPVDLAARQAVRGERGVDRRQHVRLPPRPCGCRSPRRSWLCPRPLRDRHGRPPAMHRADRCGARHGDPHKVAADPGVTVEQDRLHLQRHRIGDQPSARGKRIDCRIEHAVVAAATADEDRMRARQAGAGRRALRLRRRPGRARRARTRCAGCARRGRDRSRWRWRAATDRPASIRWRPSRRRRRCPTAIRHGVAPAPTASARGSRAW